MGWIFLAERMSSPGGTAEYIAAFLAQYFFYPAAGATIFTLIGATVFAGTIVLGRAMRLPRYWAAAFLFRRWSCWALPVRTLSLLQPSLDCQLRRPPLESTL